MFIKQIYRFMALATDHFERIWEKINNQESVANQYTGDMDTLNDRINRLYDSVTNGYYYNGQHGIGVDQLDI